MNNKAREFVMDGRNLISVDRQMSYGYLRLWVEEPDGSHAEYRMSTAELLRILQTHTFDVVRRRKFPHLKMKNG